MKIKKLWTATKAFLATEVALPCIIGMMFSAMPLTNVSNLTLYISFSALGFLSYHLTMKRRKIVRDKKLALHWIINYVDDEGEDYTERAWRLISR